MDRLTIALATLGHMHRQRMALVGAMVVMAAIAASPAAGVAVAAIVIWALGWHGHGAQGMAARAARRIAARRITRGIAIAEALADLLAPSGQIPTPAARARRRTPVTPPRSLPAAGIALTPRILPIPRTARA